MYMQAVQRLSSYPKADSGGLGVDTMAYPESGDRTSVLGRRLRGIAGDRLFVGVTLVC